MTSACWGITHLVVGVTTECAYPAASLSVRRRKSSDGRTGCGALEDGSLLLNGGSGRRGDSDLRSTTSLCRDWSTHCSHQRRSCSSPLAGDWQTVDIRPLEMEVLHPYDAISPDDQPFIALHWSPTTATPFRINAGCTSTMRPSLVQPRSPSLVQPATFAAIATTSSRSCYTRVIAVAFAARSATDRPHASTLQMRTQVLTIVPSLFFTLTRSRLGYQPRPPD